MEVKGQNAAESQSVRQRPLHVQRDAHAAQRSHGGSVRETPAAQTGGTDRLDLSASIESAVKKHEAHEAERQAKVEALRTELQQGTLNTPERIERAAARLAEG